jgi:uncharacterized cysteine cluster protein YcgN (CxxCxxCC family)
MGGEIGMFSETLENDLKIVFPFSDEIRDINLCLEHTYCPNLNPETKLCNVYKTRLQIVPWCLTGNGLFNNGALPQGCLYLKEKPEREPNPKTSFADILPRLTPNQRAALVMLINTFNNVPFMKYTKYMIQNEAVTQ